MNVSLEGIVCRLHLVHLANMEPDLVNGRPHHPSADNLHLGLMELAAGDLLLDGNLPLRECPVELHAILAGDRVEHLCCQPCLADKVVANHLPDSVSSDPKVTEGAHLDIGAVP